MKGNATCERKAQGCSVEINEDVTQPLSHRHGEGSRVQHGPAGKFTPICLWESEGLSEILSLFTIVAMSPKVGFGFLPLSIFCRKYERFRGPRWEHRAVPVCRSPSAPAGTAQPRVSPRPRLSVRRAGAEPGAAPPERGEKALRGGFFPPREWGKPGAEETPTPTPPLPAAPPGAASAGRDQKDTGSLLFGYRDNTGAAPARVSIGRGARGDADTSLIKQGSCTFGGIASVSMKYSYGSSPEPLRLIIPAANAGLRLSTRVPLISMTSSAHLRGAGPTLTTPPHPPGGTGVRPVPCPRSANGRSAPFRTQTAQLQQLYIPIKKKIIKMQ